MAEADPAQNEMVLGMVYARAVQRAGGMPVVLPPLAPQEVPELVARLDIRAARPQAERRVRRAIVFAPERGGELVVERRRPVAQVVHDHDEETAPPREAPAV